MATLLFVSCNKESQYPTLIQGTWEIKSVTGGITKNGQPANAETFIKDMASALGRDVELPEALKEELQDMFDTMSEPVSLPEGASFTFKDGKVTSGNMDNGTYTLNGNTLTINGGGQSIPFTIVTLNATDLVLTADALAFSGQGDGDAKAAMEAFKKAGYEVKMTMNCKKK